MAPRSSQPFPLVLAQDIHSAPTVWPGPGDAELYEVDESLFHPHDTGCSAPMEGGWASNPAGEIKEGFPEEVASKRVGAVFYYSLDSQL